MIGKYKGLFLLLAFLTAGLLASAQQKEARKQELWENIEPYFTPPHPYRNQYGNFRSLLNFYNRDTVRTASDWKRRRKEIRQRWMELMGPWPAFIRDQKPEILSREHREDFTQIKLRFKWTPGEYTHAYLLIPDTLRREKVPAVVTAFYEPETAIGQGRDVPYFDFAYQLTKRGFITLSIGTSRASEAKTFSLYYPSIDSAQVQPLSMLGYAAANAWYLLAGMPQVDSTRIGIIGLSFGGKWAMFASTLFDKYAAAVWSDPGIVFQEDRPSVNYWEPWYLGYHPKPWRKRGLITKENPAYGLYPCLREQGYNLHELHALMAPRPFLVSGGSEDPPERWIPLNHTRAVYRLLGYEQRVAMQNRPTHRPDQKANAVAYDFLEYFLFYADL